MPRSASKNKSGASAKRSLEMVKDLENVSLAAGSPLITDNNPNLVEQTPQKSPPAKRTKLVDPEVVPDVPNVPNVTEVPVEEDQKPAAVAKLPETPVVKIEEMSGIARSPFAKPKPKSDSDSSDDEDENPDVPTFTAYHVKPDGLKGKLEAIVIKVEGFSERVMCMSYYKRNEDLSKPFMKLVGAVPHIFNLKDKKGAVMQNKKGFDVKAICVKLEPGMANEAMCKAFIESTLVPAIIERSDGDIEEDKVAVWNDETSYKIVTSFSALYTWKEIKNYVKWGYCFGKKADYKNAKQFFQKDKTNLYSFWEPGNVPKEVIKEMKLKPIHLDEKDVAAPKLDVTPVATK